MKAICCCVTIIAYTTGEANLCCCVTILAHTTGWATPVYTPASCFFFNLLLYSLALPVLFLPLILSFPAHSFLVFVSHEYLSFVPFFSRITQELLQLPKIHPRMIFLHVMLCKGPSCFVAPLPSPSMFVARPGQASLSQLRFCNTQFFRAGEIHNHLPVWEQFLNEYSSSQVNFMEIIQEGVKID